MMGSPKAAIDLLASALGVNSTEVSAETAIGISPQWDSLAHLRLILSLESHLNRKLDPEEIVSIVKLSDVISLVDH